MMKLAFLIAATFSGTVLAQSKQVFNYNYTSFTLQSCIRLSTKDVQCSFTVLNKNTDDIFSFGSDTYRLISPKGNEVVIKAVEFNSNPIGFYAGITVRKDIEYNMKFTFADYPEAFIKYFDYGRQRLENVPIASGPTTLPTTTALPGKPDMRLRVKIGDTNYIVVLHGCYAVDAGASCLVSALPDNVKGVMGKPLTAYSGTLLQYDNQTISNGTVDLEVGDGLFRGVPVK